MKHKLAMILTGLGFLIPLCGMAQNVQFGVGVRAGVLSYNKTEIDKKKLYWGGHARVRVMKYFAGEASLQTREDTFTIHEGQIVLKTVPFQLSGIVYPLAVLPVSPYFVAGTGWYFFTATVTGDLGLPYVTGEGSISITENAPHIGVGVEGFIGDHFSVGGDVRKVFLEFDTAIIRDIKLDAYFVNIGATYYF